ncbi:MAG: ACT domain-containing protein [Actinobacteria bacterium]|nr:ACT domain-containing protein [Actinomycetota bacterium]
MEGSLLSVTVVGQDRPGIVAAIAKSLFDLGCNLEDATSTILRGHFAMVLIVRAPGQDVREVETRLAGAARTTGVAVSVGTLDESHAEITAPTHMVSVYGSDKPGIVFRIAEALAGLSANVTDLNSRVIGSEEEPVYALMLEVAAPDDVDLESALDALKQDLGVDVTVHRIEPDVL